MELSLKDRIERYMKRNRQWIHGEDIVRLSQSVGYEGETARRRLRDLMAEGKVETEARMGKRTVSNWYRYKEPLTADELFESI